MTKYSVILWKKVLLDSGRQLCSTVQKKTFAKLGMFGIPRKVGKQELCRMLKKINRIQNRNHIGLRREISINAFN